MVILMHDTAYTNDPCKTHRILSHVRNFVAAVP